MLAGKPLLTHKLVTLIVTGYVITLFTACTTVKQYPRNKPFVYKTNINVTGDFTNAEKQDLEDRIRNQLDDSVRPRYVNRVLSKVLKNPPEYNAANADKSVLFIKSLMISMGYFYDTTSYNADTAFEKPDKYPTTLTFDVRPGKLTRLDSIWFNIADTNLQQLTVASRRESVLKKGDAFAKGPISAELDRLVELYRNSGYLRFGREELIGLWDTLDVSLLQPTLDPFEQIRILEKLAERRKNPKANLEIRLRPGFDSTKLVKYYVGRVNIYPDSTGETPGRSRDSVMVAPEMWVIQSRRKFKPKIFPINIYLKHDTLYRNRQYQRTINRLTGIGTWRLINIPAYPRPGQDTVDFNIILTPADKYLFTSNVETSQNQSAIAGNLFGIGANVGVQNRNFARAANQSNFNFRYGVELGDEFIQTQQASMSYTIYFPRPVVPFPVRWLRENIRDNIRTVFNFNAANTERRDLYNLTTVNGVWGYEYSRNRPRFYRSIQWNVKIPNIEYSYLTERQGLKDLILANPSLKNIFTDGFVSSILGGYILANTREERPNVAAFNAEYSPFLAGLIPSKFLDSQLYRFVKLNAEFTQLFKWRKSSIALRAFAGFGLELNSTVNPEKRNSMPFFKQYFAGGPNSMRAWRLRKLGPGSVIKDFVENPERYGDVQLEFNAEYRFHLANISGVRLESVLFTDVGNVWLLKKGAGLPEEVFNLGRLGKDLAVGAGTGLRLDFTFFLIRLDYAYKVKDPSPDNIADQNKLFHDWKLFNGQLQIGINYPFKL
jgi:outer membrane protein insertion porin family